MKGWIKLHGENGKNDSPREMYINTRDIFNVSTGVLATDESREMTCVTIRGDYAPYAVIESVDEVMRLIAKAEGKTEKKSRLAEFLLSETYFAKKMMKESDGEIYSYNEGRRDAFMAVYEFLTESADTEEEEEE